MSVNPSHFTTNENCTLITTVDLTEPSHSPFGGDTPVRWESMSKNAKDSTTADFRGGLTHKSSGLEVRIWRGIPTLFGIQDGEIVLDPDPQSDLDYPAPESGMEAARGWSFPNEPLNQVAKQQPFVVTLCNPLTEEYGIRKRRVNELEEAKRLAVEIARQI